jgi:hypothetical protein
MNLCEIKYEETSHKDYISFLEYHREIELWPERDQ